jgi:UDP-2,3-diacylglucosamine pyrophosphatase LpxH
MLVIISDLHMTDGTSGETIRQGAFFLLRERLFSLAYDASWRAPGVYKPIDKIDLVLLGDILDVIRSSFWCNAPPHVRPWGDPTNADFINAVASINAGILANNQKSLAVIKSLSNAITVPGADANGRPLASKEAYSGVNRVTVPVSVHYLVGNHDWFYHLPGEAFDRIRASVVETMGLANPKGPFPHDPQEYPQLLEIYATHKLWARHGDIFDRDNFDGDRNKSSLGDAIVVELLNRFPGTVRDKLGAQLPAECLDGLKEIDNVRPLLVIPTWIASLLRRTCSKEQADAVKQIWNELATNFLKIDFVKRHKSALKFGLKFSEGMSLANLSKALLWLKAKLGVGNEGPFYPNALTEEAYKQGTAHFIIYGHTHHYELVALRAANPKAGRPFDQTYINSGTWRAVHEMAAADPKAEEFAGYKVMTYLIFYKDDERVGREFESWSGALGSST